MSADEIESHRRSMDGRLFSQERIILKGILDDLRIEEAVLVQIVHPGDSDSAEHGELNSIRSNASILPDPPVTRTPL